ncbi:hypothetical protein ACAW74_09390 [Fibrella sp. WM1]|uniref:hypothetical protein n=1 Tax=Fibrella musci TaxID=3242485 RepID=UPI0035219A38
MTNTLFLRWGWLLLSACLFGLLGYTIARTQFSGLIGLYFLLFWGYNLRVRPLLEATVPLALHPQPDRFLFGSALLFRLLLIGALPALSDDYARFIWDGRLLLSGVNPFRYLPSELMAGGAGPTIPIDASLYALLNSPNYFTVYPPVNQAIFALAAWASPNSLLGSVVLMRSLIILAEIGTIGLMVKLLIHYKKDPNLALLYALNPLVILELTGNVHFEGMMIGFVLLAIWLWVRPTPTPRSAASRMGLSAGAFALGVCTKLIPLMLLPLAITQLGWRRGMLYSGLVGGLVALLFIPFFDLDMVQHMFMSIDLYFRKFEFNASLYYLIRAAGYWFYDYNWLSSIGGWLSLLTTGGLLLIAFNRLGRRVPVAVRALWMLTLYFLMATTVHPWYITSLVAAAVFTATDTARPFRYPLLWSGLIWVSYAAYQYSPVYEKPVLLLVEYVPVLALLIFEIKRNRDEVDPADVCR